MRSSFHSGRQPLCCRPSACPLAMVALVAAALLPSVSCQRESDFLAPDLPDGATTRVEPYDPTVCGVAPAPTAPSMASPSGATQNPTYEQLLGIPSSRTERDKTSRTDPAREPRLEGLITVTIPAQGTVPPAIVDLGVFAPGERRRFHFAVQNGTRLTQRVTAVVCGAAAMRDLALPAVIAPGDSLALACWIDASSQWTGEFGRTVFIELQSSPMLRIRVIGHVVRDTRGTS